MDQSGYSHRHGQTSRRVLTVVLVIVVWLAAQPTDRRSSSTMAAAATCPCSLWNNTTMPAVAATADTQGVELGMKFQAMVPGYITGVRFYKGVGNAGPHVGHLWTASGILLATASFIHETATGWQQASFSTPIAISAHTTYVVSYYAPTGRYAVNAAHFATSGIATLLLRALANAEHGGNGVHRYGASGFPTQSFNSNNYWVDVVFNTDVPAAINPLPAISELVPSTATTGGGALTLTVYGTNFVANSVVRWSGADRLTTFVSATQLQAEIPASDIALLGMALVTVFNPPPGGGMSGPLAFNTWAGTACPCSLWSNATIPAVTSDPDAAAVEVGMKFRASINGFITGVRFYKGTGNTGPHPGHLWTATGELLGVASFAHGAAMGWQQASFSTPIAIGAHTTYVVSYYAPQGHYANNVGYFAGAGVTNGPLRALASVEDGGNGVFTYGVSSFPTQTFNAINYWVDVVFMPELPHGTFADATLADFSAGTMDTTTYIGQSPKGEVMLAPTVGVEFTGNTLPVGWTATSWSKGGSARVTDGRLTVHGTRVGTAALFGPGRALEFMATFSGAANQHVGFGLNPNEPPWTMFSTHSGGSLWARTRLGSTSQDTPLAANWLRTPHRFHINWTETSVVYAINGTVVATHLLGLTTSMRPVISDPTAGEGTVVVDWLRLTPYAAAGTFLSRVLDAGAIVPWENVTWTSTVPAGTSLGLSVRQGNTPAPDGSWTAFVPLAWSGTPIGGSARYLQYRAILTSTIPVHTPTLHGVTITYGPKR